MRKWKRMEIKVEEIRSSCDDHEMTRTSETWATRCGVQSSVTKTEQDKLENCAHIHFTCQCSCALCRRCSGSWWSRCHWCRARFHHADAISLMVTLSLVSCSVPPRKRNSKCRVLSFWILRSTFALVVRLYSVWSSISSVANYCTLFHRENGSFEVLSLHPPSVTVDRRQL